MRGKIILISLFFLLSAFLILGNNNGGGSEIFLSPFPGSKVIYHEQKSFNEFYFLKAQKIFPDKYNNLKNCKQIKVEGKVTKVIYGLPKNRSAYEVFKNYELALKKSGFIFLSKIRTKFIRDFVGKVCKFPDIWGFGSEDNNAHFYISAKSPRGDKYVSVYVGDGYLGRPGKAAVGVVEVKNMETGLITAKNIKEELDSYGHVALYGIYFDFNKANIKPESEPTIKEIAKFLKKNPGVKLYVVGHTDNVGKLEYNMELSKKRAESVVNELVTKYGISRDRLKPFGVGPLAPVATNKTKEGRAKNRRVELIEQ